MRFLLDQNQSPQPALLLIEAGHDAVHVRDLDMARSTDREILECARTERRVIVSGDTDVGDLLAAATSAKPSLVLLRRQDRRRAHQVGALLLSNLDAVADTSRLER